MYMYTYACVVVRCVCYMFLGAGMGLMLNVVSDLARSRAVVSVGGSVSHCVTDYLFVLSYGTPGSSFSLGGFWRSRVVSRVVSVSLAPWSFVAGLWRWRGVAPAVWGLVLVFLEFGPGRAWQCYALFFSW